MKTYAKLIDEKDNVVTLLSDCQKGDEITVNFKNSRTSYTADSPIQFGHKMAISRIGKGQNVIKYGAPIGSALEDIAAGDWVHTHNVKDEYKCLDKQDNPLPGQED